MAYITRLESTVVADPDIVTDIILPVSGMDFYFEVQNSAARATKNLVQPLVPGSMVGPGTATYEADGVTMLGGTLTGVGLDVGKSWQQSYTLYLIAKPLATASSGTDRSFLAGNFTTAASGIYWQNEGGTSPAGVIRAGGRVTPSTTRTTDLASNTNILRWALFTLTIKEAVGATPGAITQRNETLGVSSTVSLADALVLNATSNIRLGFDYNTQRIGTTKFLRAAGGPGAHSDAQRAAMCAFLRAEALLVDAAIVV